MIMGTPCYMAPEQAEGKSREVGPAADIYALGVILYEMLTGRPPFTAESPLETVMMLFQAEAIPPTRLQPKVPRDLETICLKCLYKDPRRRYASANDLADDLARFLSGEPIHARPASLWERVSKWARRRPAAAAAAACSVLGLVCFLGLLVWHHVRLNAEVVRVRNDELEARAAEEATAERVRLAGLTGKVKDLLHAGESALAAADWARARLELTRAHDQAGGEPELADLRTRIGALLASAEGRRNAHERLEAFRRLRNDAQLHATLYTGASRAAALADASGSARAALAIFAEPPAGAHYTTQQNAEIRAGRLELLVLLADAVAAGDGDPAARADEALAVLDGAARLGVTHAHHRRRAQLLATAGRRDEAAREAALADAKPPASALDHFLLGQEKYRAGDNGAAARSFEAALQQEPGHFWAASYLSLCRLKTRRYEEAAAGLTACLAQRPDLPWLRLLRASARAEMKDYALAEADFAEARRPPLSDAALFGLLVNRGVMRYHQGDLVRAGDDLRRAIDLRPAHYQGHHNLAQVHLKAGRLDAAIQSLEDAIRRSPAPAGSYRLRAYALLQRRDDGAALIDLERAARLDPRADDHIERGRILHRRDRAAALAAYDEALGLRPGDAVASRLRADVLLALGRDADALAALDECLKRSPRDVAAVRARGAVRAKLGQHAAAQADFTRALEVSPDAATFAARGWAYLAADAPRLALADFEESIRLDPASGDACAGRGVCRALLGDARRAAADAEEALRRGPASPRLDYNVARVLALTSRHGDNRAIQLLARSLDARPPAEASRFWHGVVRGDRALASLQSTPAFRRLADRFPRPAE